MQKEELFFLKIPSCDYIHILESIKRELKTGNNSLREVSHSEYYESRAEIPPMKLGVAISHPADRLALAYEQSRKANVVQHSFEQFYRENIRANLYSKLLKDINISELGYIGLDKYPVRNQLLCEKWLKSRFKRLTYNKFNNIVLPQISKNDLENISKIFEEDIFFYEQIVREYERRWGELCKTNKLSIPEQKSVIIHLGPPKTGTSSIQYFLNNQKAALTKARVFYPSHNTDSNNVSSGNFTHLITRDKNDEFYFDDDKARKLLKKFIASNAKTLLLSSEHFYYYLPWLFMYFADAKYVFYIRHPLSMLESGYHQGIKRHKRTEPFMLPSPANMKFQQLDMFLNIALEFKSELVYGYFDKSLFKNGSLIEDFMNLIDINLPIEYDNKLVNNQYCYEASEFMRQCNSFASDWVLGKLDRYLQFYSSNRPAFTFIHTSERSKLNRIIEKNSKGLIDKAKGLDLDKITSLTNNYVDDIFMDARYKPNFIDLLSNLKKHEPLLASSLRKELKHSELIDKQKYMECLNLSIIEKIKFELNRFKNKE